MRIASAGPDKAATALHVLHDPDGDRDARDRHGIAGARGGCSRYGRAAGWLDAPGGGLVGAKGEYPHCPLYRQPVPHGAPMNKLQPIILDTLRQLKEKLGHFEQPTHTSLGPSTIRAVATALVDVWEKPTAYNISELDQAIQRLASPKTP
jgi:hypothetical protein